MEKWTIFKGWHYSLSNFWKRFIPKIGAKPVKYEFNLPIDTWFEYSTPDDLDINKLFGFSFMRHHTNSVRVGWTPDFKKEGQFTLWFYIYNGGIRTIKRFTNIKADIDYTLTISFVKELNYVSFDMTGGGVSVKASEIFFLPSCKIGYYLWFYFGGNKKAPKEIITWIKKS
jgi:hypothetical protein